MFTGLVQHVGAVASVEPEPAGARIAIHASSWSHRPSPGDSINVAGVCLTVASSPDEAASGILAFDAISETLNRSTLSDLSAGDPVNLEHAATPSTLLGGHLVQGHVDAVGEVTGVTDNPADWRVGIRLPREHIECVTPKGSICIDGVSLTVASVRGTTFEVALIPETLERTTLKGLRVGDRCNVETDILARTVVHWLRHHAPRR